MTLATITSKGQITIPKSIRDSLKLHTGDKIQIIATSDREALIKPISKKTDEVFGKLYKADRKAFSTEEIDKIVRQKMKDIY